MRSTLFESAANYVRGLLMGGADVIPGVSGGTVALIVGIYERLIAAITHVYAAVVALIRGDVEAFRSRLSEVEWNLIVPLGAGIATAILIGSAIIPDLMRRYPVEMRGVFFGLIVGSIAIPWGRMNERGWAAAGIATVAAVAAFLIVGLPERDPTEPSLVAVFFMASVAICAMILPGVSGAFLLLVMGIYAPTLEAIQNVNIVYILVFAAGAAVGLGSFARMLNWLLEHRHDATMAALVGLMAGSLRALWPWSTVDGSLLLPESFGEAAVPTVLVVAGVAFVLILSKISAGRKPAGQQAISS